MSKATDDVVLSIERARQSLQLPRKPKAQPHADPRCQRQSNATIKNSQTTNKALASDNQPRQSCLPSVVAVFILIDARFHPDCRATSAFAGADLWPRFCMPWDR